MNCITNKQVKELQDNNKLSHFLSVGRNMNYYTKQDEFGNITVYRERTNCDFNDKNRFVFAANVLPLV